jgi:hypothetical protein
MTGGTNQPRTLECSGSELAGLLADLKARGCIVLGMTSICVSRWRLSLDWPDQQGTPRTGRPTGDTVCAVGHTPVAPMGDTVSCGGDTNTSHNKGPSTSVLRTGDQNRVVELDSNKTMCSDSI